MNASTIELVCQRKIYRFKDGRLACFIVAYDDIKVTIKVDSDIFKAPIVLHYDFFNVHIRLLKLALS